MRAVHTFTINLASDMDMFNNKGAPQTSLRAVAQLFVRYGHGTVWGEQADVLARTIQREIRELGADDFELAEFSQDFGGHPHRHGDNGKIYYRVAAFNSGGLNSCSPRIFQSSPVAWRVTHGFGKDETCLLFGAEESAQPGESH
jgi:hypothetical protein